MLLALLNERNFPVALLELPAVEHEALKLVLNSRELKESHRKIAFIQQRQLQRQQHVQKLLANGLRLGQLEHELVYLEEQDEVLKKQANITNILPSIL